MRDFGMALEDCGLTSMKYKGYKFTWTNNRTGDDRVQLRLDRGWRMLHSVQWARRFMFEEMWTEVDGCTETVVQAWGKEQGDLVTKLKACQQSLLDWNKSKVGHIPMQIQQIQRQFDGFKKKPQTDDVVRCQRRLAGELDILLAREEMIWQQRSRVSWLKYEDHNTKFFHAQAKQRGRRNFMQGIFYEHNVWNTSNEGVGSIFCEYFKKYSPLVVRMILALYWHVREINHTLVTLIPKVDNPTRVTEYRPISLCSVLYKLISKTLVNRMKGIMQDVISEYQSAFVPSQLITDNIIAAFESIHAIQRRRGSALKKMILKLDIIKLDTNSTWYQSSWFDSREGREL
ncbi:hypothetical protein PRUPE_1G178200 [Prunus persica]|uniref:Uncharacterized protein n=1 Tax=Prunus persica TaxID=3760 RepID=A0A251QYY6_PRUPE|nr:hypothetical protein PRUPE_1G178200 [Prunus persica]